MVLGPRIAAARKQKKMTQKELAAILGLATGTVQQYELGKRRPDIDVLKAIASALDVSVDALVSVNEPEDEYELICDTLNTAGLSIAHASCTSGDADKDIYYISRVEDPDDPDLRIEIEYSKLANIIHQVLEDADAKKEEYIQKRLDAEFSL